MRNKTILTRVTEKEHEELKRKAKENDMSLSQYMRKSSIAGQDGLYRLGYEVALRDVVKNFNILIQEL